VIYDLSVSGAYHH